MGRKHKHKRLTRTQDRLPGKILTTLLLVAEFIFTVVLLDTRILPVKFIAVIITGLILMMVLIYLLLRKWRKHVRFWTGVVLMVFMLAGLSGGGFYIYKTVTTLDDLTGVNKQTTEINVYVLESDAAQNLSEASSYNFGYLASLDRENTDRTLNQIYDQIGSGIQTSEYANLSELADNLVNGTSQAIILNRGYLDVLDEMGSYSSFSSQVRPIASFQLEDLVTTKEKTEETADANEASENTENHDEAVTDEVYTLYISGIDTRGELTASSLSDVNIILTVNTRTKQILMVSTPRDYYVPLSISNGEKDKLTHAGVYGIDVCMDTMEMLYDINIDYYFRLNFGGFIKIIDALGGITVKSDYEFDSQNSSGYHFNKGENFVNGEAALAFCRERHAFSEGDRQRGRNQMAVIQGVVNKVTSAAFLKNYLSVLDSLNGCFETSVPYDLIASLVRDQLDKGGNWQVLSFSVNGTGDTQKPYSMSQNAYVMIPDEATVEKAKTLMKQVREGVMISEGDLGTVTSSADNDDAVEAAAQ